MIARQCQLDHWVLRGAFGNDTAGWVNKVIIIFRTTVESFGKPVPGLRVRIPPPKQAAAAQQPAPRSPSGNGAATPARAAAPAAVEDDPDLAPDPKPSIEEELDDGIPEKW